MHEHLSAETPASDVCSSVSDHNVANTRNPILFSSSLALAPRDFPARISPTVTQK
jgi:hypothetical protein